MKEIELGQQYENEGNLEQAIIKYREATQIDPDSAEAYLNLGKAFMKDGQWMKAITSYQKLVELEPSRYVESYELGEYLQELGHFDKALDCYKKIAETLADQEKLSDAISVYNKATEVGLEVHWLYLYIGDLESRQSNLEGAIEAYLKAIEIAPEFWQPHDRILIRLQRVEMPKELLEKMIVAYEDVIEKKPDYLLARSNLGDILTKLGRLDKAIDCYQRATYRYNSQHNPEFVNNAWDSNKKGQEPAFIVIGSMRSGTTSLYEYIAQHPNFVPALKKEIKFFNFNWQSGKDWYLAHFPSIAENSGYITGEGSPDYMYFPVVAQRIADLFPNMKLIVMLRNPIDRSISQYYHWLKVGAEYRSLEESINSDIDIVREMASPSFDGQIKREKGQKGGCLLESVYHFFLEKWLSVIPRDNFLVLKSEDFYQDPAKIMKQVFDFIGVPEFYLSEYKTYNANIYSSIDESMRNKLKQCFEPHNRYLEKLLNLTFDWS